MFGDCWFCGNYLLPWVAYINVGWGWGFAGWLVCGVGVLVLFAVGLGFVVLCV